MRNLRLWLTLLAAICMLALGAYALANRPALIPGDDIIIKGGSLEIQCGSNHGIDCFGTHDANGKYKHKKTGNHITKIVVKDSSNTILFDSSDPQHCGGSALGNKPEITISYPSPTP